MGATEALVVSTRLKREDCKRTKHDSVFSEFKILIGPSDWEDHSLGKEGAARYRIHNLPICSSCPGVYELGIAVPRTRSGRDVSKLDPDHIIPVYTGQADNVRTRLQRYGQSGAHLENGSSTGELNDSVQKGPGLFTEIFSRGFPIVFRWAPMKNKRDAEKTEAQLLDTFDYAWNKGSNGARRPDDILQKLNCSTSGTTRFSAIARKLQIFHQKPVGVRIKACQPLLLESGPSINTTIESNNLLSRIFKFSRSHPKLVLMRFVVDEDHTNICGVALGHGSVCRRSPVEGRKRCTEHKGMKINGSFSKLITKGKSHDGGVSTESSIISDPECGIHGAPSLSYNTVKPQLVVGNHLVDEDSSLVCGVPLYDGSPCQRQPLQRRKRCEEHRGRKIHKSVSELVTEGKQHYVRGPLLESSTCHNDYEKVSSETCKTGTLQSQLFSQRSVANKKCDIICGVDLEYETFCTRWPVVGRKSCEEHKGMRVKESMSRSQMADIPSLFDSSGNSTCNDQKYDNTSSRSISYRNADDEEFSSTCGANLADDSFCKRQPLEGRKGYLQHKGMKGNSSYAKGMMINGIMSKVVEDKLGTFDTSSGISTCFNEDFSSTCGAPLGDGSFCRRQPTEGRKRCCQHKGMRANSSLSYNSISDTEASSSHICGAALKNGSICSRLPVHGRKRCEQHKGMRAATPYYF